MERILSKVDKKIFIDEAVGKQALPLFSLDGTGTLKGGR
jgi:hypothetical protein